MIELKDTFYYQEIRELDEGILCAIDSEREHTLSDIGKKIIFANEEARTILLDHLKQYKTESGAMDALKYIAVMVVMPTIYFRNENEWLEGIKYSLCKDIDDYSCASQIRYTLFPGE